MQSRSGRTDAVKEYPSISPLVKPTSLNLTVALGLARAGYAVFPARPNKRPLVKWGNVSTTDPEQIRAWWRRWPNAMPGLPTGARNGLAVLDLDCKIGKDGVAALHDLGLDVDSLSHVAVTTPSGGRHIYFAHRSGLRNSANEIASGVDVRAEGGHVIAPGAANEAGAYTLAGCDLVEDVVGLPRWPEQLSVRQKRGETTPATRNCDARADHVSWARDRLEAKCREVGDIEEGQRNETLNGAAYYLGGVVARGLLGGKEVEYALLSACARNELLKHDGVDQCRKTISSGLAAGRAVPRFPPVTADEFADAAEDEEAEDSTAGEGSRLAFLKPSECEAGAGRPYVVKGLIAQGDVACIVGAPGAGKSLLAPALSYALAQGRETFGLRTKAGPVFYVAVEDAHGMCARVAALRREHGEAEDFTLVTGVSDLLRMDSPDLKALRQAVKEQRPELIVVDTLAMAFPGLEENEACSMGRVVAVARSLTKWGAAVILVHHDTKDGQQKLPRGHSLLNGALDVSLHLSRDDGGIVRGRLTKNRNGPCDKDIAFAIDVQELGTDDDGDQITAAYARELPPGAGGKAPRLNKSQKGFMAILHRHLNGGLEADESAVRTEAIEGCDVSGSEDRDSRRRAVNRAICELSGKGLIEIRDGRVRLLGTAADEFEDTDHFADET